jgi:uncharacterized SAM-binding protein YcdF (DUF218 family)
VRTFSKGKLLVFLLLIGILLFWQYPRLLGGLGQFLVREDRPEKADLIICLSGSLVDRTLTSADLYRAGWSHKIFIFREEKPDGYDLLEKRGIRLPEARDLVRRILLSSGVPEGAILTDEREVTSTYDEARIVRDFLRSHPLSKLILVTSKYHSRRAHLTFRSLLNAPKIQIFSCPTPYDEFDPQRWWKQESIRERVFFEYEKLLAYLVQGRIRPSLLLKRN